MLADQGIRETQDTRSAATALLQETNKMANRNQHVVPRPDGRWAVRPERASRASSTHDTQREAIKQAKSVAKNQGTELFIHRGDGTIRERNTYGPDPYPPKG